MFGRFDAGRVGEGRSEVGRNDDGGRPPQVVDCPGSQDNGTKENSIQNDRDVFGACNSTRGTGSTKKDIKPEEQPGVHESGDSITLHRILAKGL